MGRRRRLGGRSVFDGFREAAGAGAGAGQYGRDTLSPNLLFKSCLIVAIVLLLSNICVLALPACGSKACVCQVRELLCAIYCVSDAIVLRLVSCVFST